MGSPRWIFSRGKQGWICLFSSSPWLVNEWRVESGVGVDAGNPVRTKWQPYEAGKWPCWLRPGVIAFRWLYLVNTLTAMS